MTPSTARSAVVVLIILLSIGTGIGIHALLTPARPAAVPAPAPLTTADALQAANAEDEALAEAGLTRPFLHACRLAFPHPDDGRPVTVVDPLPDDLAAVLRHLAPELLSASGGA